MDDGKTWERLLEEQTDLFRKTTQKNNDLEARVAELEQELSVWKLAFSTTEQEKLSLTKQVTRLERNIGSLKEDNPLVLCLIDGDGNIFSANLLAQGRSGGAQAAQLITKGITEYLAKHEDSAGDSYSISGRALIWVSVFCNKTGLQETVTSRQLCTKDDFESFVMGFNQASPLFSILDVGNGKEAADTKIKEYLRVFARFPQTCKIFFGGGHDNGYAATLNSLNNEGLLEKVVLLRGYHEVAFELRALSLRDVEFEGVFMTRKLPFNPPRKGSSHSIGETENLKRPPKTLHVPHPSITKHKTKSHLGPVMLASGIKFDPPPCNFHYLAICKSAGSCRYGHDYELSPEDIGVMRINAKKSPCGHANRNQPCPLSDICPLSHHCPAGPKCKFFRSNKCKFTGSGMHSDTPTKTTNSTPTPKSSTPASAAAASLSEEPEDASDQTMDYEWLRDLDKNCLPTPSD